MALMAARAEIALARGDVATGLRLYDEAVDSVARVEGIEFGGLSPWVMLAASASLVARVSVGSTVEDRRRAAELRDILLEQHIGGDTGGALPYLDFPLNGVLVAAIGAWRVVATEDGHEDGLRLLAIAHRWSYNRSFPVMAWDRLSALAERESPGRLGEIQAEYAERTAADLVGETRALLERVGTVLGR
jgi:hypothetical protein